MLRLEFDPVRNKLNIAKHGVALSLAHLFELENALIGVDDRQDYSETRHVAIGFLSATCMLWSTLSALTSSFASSAFGKRTQESKGDMVTDRKKPARISRKAWDDAEIPELTEDSFKSAKPAKDVLPPAVYTALVKRRAPGERGPQKAPTKVPTKIRIDPDVLEAYKAKGKGWQTHMNEVLRQGIHAVRKSRTARKTS